VDPRLLFALAFPPAAPFCVHLDARERGLHPLVTAPVLVLTILFGPLGLLAHLVVRAVVARRPSREPALP
jgi:Domain of unknown function (DUF4281)